MDTLKSIAIEIKATPGNPFCHIDKLYGPRAARVRARIAGMLAGGSRLLPLSDKRCQYGRLRRDLLAAYGIAGTCIADADRQFQQLLVLL